MSWTKVRTFARVLRDSGYATAIGGSWQINDLGKQPDALKQHGFDEHCVWTGTEAGRAEAGERDRNRHILTNGRRDTVPSGPDTINSFLINFITRKRENPFLVYYPMPLTCGPHATTPHNKDTDSESKERRCARYVTDMDQRVGKLMDAVDNAGLGHNTMIVFTGENGSAVAGELNGKTFEEGKGQPADRGAHVPLVVRAPFLTPSGRMVRDWQHILDNGGNFHDLTKDPLQQREVRPLDKIAPGRRQRLEMILKRFPKDATAPLSQ